MPAGNFTPQIKLIKKLVNEGGIAPLIMNGTVTTFVLYDYVTIKELQALGFDAKKIFPHKNAHEVYRVNKQDLENFVGGRAVLKELTRGAEELLSEEDWNNEKKLEEWLKRGDNQHYRN